MIYIGIDNGVTGSIGMVAKNGFNQFILMPTITEQNYTKKKQQISRVSYLQLKKLLELPLNPQIKVLLERPMTNPTRYKAVVSGMRCLEAVLIAVEVCGHPYEYIDSKEWQKAMLPKGVKGTPDLKKASVDIGIRLFPHYKELILKHKDADGLLIAEYARIKG